jgi:DNA-binding CsgD family transcriptional regulator
LHAISGAIPFDGYRFLGIDPRTLLVNRVLAASDNDLDPRNEWLREVYLQSGRLSYIEIPSMMRAGLYAAAMQDRQEQSYGYTEDLLGQLTPREHYDLFHELRSPVGGTLFGCFPARKQWVGAVQVYRRDGLRPFRPTDVAFMKLVAPVIGEAVAASLGREQALTSAETVPGASGVVMLGKSGDMLFATPTAEPWLALLNDAGTSSHAPIASAIWAARAALLATADNQAASTLIVPTASGPARIEASRAGPDGSVAIVIAAARPAEALDIPVYWPLTEREREIATLALRGLDADQIAGRVFLSASTVDWHLWNIYTKLEVDGRSGLYARFFREVVLPGVEPAGQPASITESLDPLGREAPY